MGYSASDFVQDCDANAEAYDVPGLTGEVLDALGIDLSDEQGPSENEQQRILAERIAQALRDRRNYRAALKSILKCEDISYVHGLVRDALGEDA